MSSHMESGSVFGGELRDARSLQLKLYRKIGLSAVAAALEAAKLPDRSERSQNVRLSPAILVSDSKAA